jgi:hypothetical protein
VNVSDIVQRLNAKRSGKGWVAKCPSHDDGTPSLAIDEGSDGRALLKCHAGCNTDDVLAALGMTRRDLFPQPINGNGAVSRSWSHKEVGPETSQPLFGWRACVEAFIDKHVEGLAKLRGYSRETCRWLKDNELIGVYDGKLALPVVDNDGRVVAVHCWLREEGKWYYHPRGARPYPLVIGELHPGESVHLFESQFDAFAFMDVSGEHSGIIITRGASNGARAAGLIPKGATVYCWTQNDAPGEKWQADICGKSNGAAVKRAKIPAPHKDLNDWTRAGAADKDLLNAIVEAAEVVKAPAKSAQATNADDQTIALLAALHPLEYERQREQKAKDMNCRASVLDKLVEARRVKGNDTLQGSDVIFPEAEPWPDHVDGASVLNEVARKAGSYIALPDGAADAIALWIAHAHSFEAFIHSPRLNFRSPERGCGKTTALDVVGVLTPRPLRTESITSAVLFRLVESHKPTLLLDEVDAYLKEANELRGLLNAGHKRGAKALRCEGEDNAVRCFAAFSPAALAGIGELPGTLHDRAIVIMLVRAKPDEVAARFDSRRTEGEMELCRKLTRWTADNFEALKDCDPQLPGTAVNRLSDNWRPLFTIAQIAGKDWPRRASEAFAKLTSSFDLDAQGVGTTLLADIASIFGKEGTDKLPSAKLADSLAAIEGRPWAEWGRQRKPISPNQLANLLRPFGISPQVIRIGDETPRGYLLEQFQEQFDRYLPLAPPSRLQQCNNAR